MVTIDLTVSGYLSRLGKLTNEVLAEMQPGELPGAAVNWADLQCNDVRLKAGQNGLCVQVVVSEAAPECGELIGAVRDGLVKSGLSPVELATLEIITEW